MVLGNGDIHAQVFFLVQYRHLLDGRGAGRGHQRLAAQVFQRLDVRTFLGQDAVADHEHGRRKGDLLLAFQVVGGRAALEVDGAIGHQRNPVGRSDRAHHHFEFTQTQVFLQGGDHLHAQVNRIPLVLLFVVEIGKRHRAIAHAERDGAGFFDLGQGAGQFLGLDWRHAADDANAEQRGDNFGQFHEFS